MSDRPRHQSGAETATTASGINGERTKQQRGPPFAERDVPEPYGADEPATVGRDQRECWQPAFAQPLGSLGVPGGTEAQVKEGVASRGIGRPFMADHHHGQLHRMDKRVKQNAEPTESIGCP